MSTGIWSGKTVVVAGNGPAIAQIPDGTVLASDRILRINNFFLEERYYLGPRVDLVMLGGDPRVAPFMASTLADAQAHYDIAGWVSRDPRVAGKVRPQLRGLTEESWPAFPKDLQHMLATQCQAYQRQPLTGTYAVLLAYALGAAHVVLVGMDLYASATRYAFTPGPIQKSLLGADLGERAHDARLHDPDLDRAILAALAEAGTKDGTRQLRFAGPQGALSDILDVASMRDGERPQTDLSKPAITDWTRRAGLYPASLLRIMRGTATLARRLGLSRTIPGPERAYLPSDPTSSTKSDRS